MRISNNPFYILNCNLENNEKNIHEKSVLKYSELDEQICKVAENILINPNKRLEAEVAWFLGFDSKTINKKLNDIELNLKNYINDLFIYKSNNYLAEANFLSFGIEKCNDIKSLSLEEIRLIYYFLCYFYEGINVYDIKRQIENYRKISKFSLNIPEEDLINFINKQKEYYLTLLSNLLNSIDSIESINILILLINEATENQRKPCKWSLLEKIIMKYESNNIVFFNNINKMINLLINEILDNILPNKLNKNYLIKNYEKIEEFLSLWNIAIKPIVIIKKLRGVNDQNTENLYKDLRKLIIISSEKYKQYEFSIIMTKLCKHYLGNVDSVYCLTNKDYNYFSSLHYKQENHL